jgi:hypothetical protein
MGYRGLGRTGWSVSEISFGAWAIGGTDGLRRRVLPLQLGVQALQLFEAVHPAVVRRVVDDLGVAAVVRVARADDAVGQVLGFRPRGFESGVGGECGIRHHASLGGGADTAVAASPATDHTETGTAETVVAMVNWPMTRVPS